MRYGATFTHFYGQDSEMSLVEPIFDFKPSTDKTWVQKYLSIVYSFPFFLVLYWVSYFSRWRNIISGVQVFRPQELIVFSQLLAFSFAADNFLQAVLSWVIIHTTASFYFGLFSFTVAHHHPSIWHDGDEARPDPDFGWFKHAQVWHALGEPIKILALTTTVFLSILRLCQLDAVRERSDGIYDNLFFVMTRYGEHSLHHLFPSVCHSKLKYLKPTLLETLEQFREELLAFPEWQLYLGTYKQLRKTEGTPFFKLTKENDSDKNKRKVIWGIWLKFEFSWGPQMLVGGATHLLKRFWPLRSR